MLIARRKLFEERAAEACELRQHSLSRLLEALDEAKEFLGGYQSLQEQFNQVVSDPVNHPAPHQQENSHPGYSCGCL